jgi:DNA-binding NarL/FixJ family response regulator
MTLNCIAVDDEPAGLNTIINCIYQNHNLKLVSSFHNPLEALEYLQNNSIDLLITDLDMPQLSGFDLFEKVHHQCKTIFVTGYATLVLEAMGKNAIDILNKPLQQIQFDNAINKALIFIENDKAILATTNIKTKFELLSIAEKKILIEIGKGKSNKEIADAIAISINTIDTHKTNIKHKLGLATSHQLTVFAYELLKII